LKLPLFVWAIFVTAILLLLALPVLAGRFYIVPALNLAICWEHFLQILESQSAGNLNDLNLLGILREYTPEAICYSSLIPLKLNNVNSINFGKFSSYLSGLIEGDGSIITPKFERSSKLNYPSIQICFHLKDLPLALLIQKNLGFGSLHRKKGINSYTLTINNHEGILKTVNILNGNMRTPKIQSLFKLIDWLNHKDSNYNLEKLPLTNKSLNENAWLSGMIESDGHFSLRSSMNAKYPRFECKFELNYSYKDESIDSSKLIKMEIAKFLDIKNYGLQQKNISNYSNISIKTQNIKSNEILINYLTQYPLWSSNFLNYKDWLIAFDLFKQSKLDPKILDLDRIKLLKGRMHNNRTIFNWDHLQHFYNLNSVNLTMKSNFINKNFHRKLSTHACFTNSNSYFLSPSDEGLLLATHRR
jgi:hypothetical protein